MQTKKQVCSIMLSFLNANRSQNIFAKNGESSWMTPADVFREETHLFINAKVVSKLKTTCYHWSPKSAVKSELWGDVQQLR